MGCLPLCVTGINQLNNLTNLHFSAIRVTDETLIELANNGPSKLFNLSFYLSSKITDASILALAKSKSTTSLTNLEVIGYRYIPSKKRAVLLV